MEHANSVKVFINSLLLHPTIQNLKLVDDKGISVSTHTYDVLRIAVKNIKGLHIGGIEEAAEEMNLFAVLVGIIIHDTTKGSLRLNDSEISHSAVMKKHPDIAISEAREILENVQEYTDLKIKEETLDLILHIVASHHGRWGKIKPETKEARFVYEADKYSAMYHRITPIGAKNIIKYMVKGFGKEEIAKITGYTEGVIENRLKRSKMALNVRSNKDLVRYYKKNGNIPEGDDFFSRRIKETQKLIRKVENVGFESLVMSTAIMAYIDDDDVFV